MRLQNDIRCRLAHEMFACFCNVCVTEKKKAQSLAHMRTISKMATPLLQQIYRQKSRVP